MRAQLSSLVLVAALTGCSGSAPRAVTGQLMAAPANAVVTARASDHQQASATVAAGGRFTLQLATNTSWSLAVGPAQLDWPTASGPARWAKLGGGATLDLGHVSLKRDGHWACDHQGSDDDHCDKDDDRDGGDDGDDGDDGDGDHHSGGGHACDGGSGSTGTGGVN
jgi:hypothetical protein